MSKIRLCPECLEKIKKASRRGGLAGSHADKVRAGRMGAYARRFHAIKITHNGRTLSVVEWSRETKISKETIWRRLRKKLSTAEVLQPHGAEHLPI